MAAINSGQFGAARELLNRAHARTEEPNLLARIEASLAYVHVDRGDAAGALELCNAALRRPGLDPTTVGVVESQRALLLMRQGETGRALRAFERAIGVLVDSPADRGKAHLNRGGVYLQQGSPGRAAEDFVQAALWLGQAGDVQEAAKARHNLGYAELLTGNLAVALRELEKAAAVLAPVSPVMRAICEADRAEVLMAAGLTSEGERGLREAAALYGQHRLRQRQGEAEFVLARSLLIATPEEALRVGRAARRRFLAPSSEAWRVRADSVILAAEVELGRRGVGLLDRADQTAAALTAQGLRSIADLTRLHAARVEIRRGRSTEAATRMRRVRLREDTPLTVRMLRRITELELARAEGRQSLALRHAARGLDELHLWVSTFGSLDLQTSAVGRGRRLAEEGLELAVESGRPEVVFEWSERARMLASRLRPMRPPQDPALAADLAELRLLQRVDWAPEAERRRADDVRRRVRERALQVTGSGEVTQPVRLAALQSGLGTEIAIVAYVVAAGELVAFVVTDRATELRRLGDWGRVSALLGGLLPDLDMAASDLSEPFATSVRGELAARLADLDSLLVVPLLPLLDDRRVVLTPSGLLAGLPWGLLPGFRGRPVSVSRSATSWLGRQRTPPSLASAGFVAGPRVARAEAEVRAAAEMWPDPVVLLGDAATAAAVSDLAARVDVLHVSAHGRHSSENPLFSGLELADGPWFGYDIDQLPEIPSVVLLSACEVGRSQVRFGEELIGMTTAWLHAGASVVIASAAAVNDEIAHDVLAGVHRGLRAGLDPAAALAAVLPPASADAPPAPFVSFC